eukprot:365252-Chlamydomonas_euryale.AAC.22
MTGAESADIVNVIGRQEQAGMGTLVDKTPLAWCLVSLQVCVNFTTACNVDVLHLSDPADEIIVQCCACVVLPHASGLAVSAGSTMRIDVKWLLWWRTSETDLW